MEITGQRDNMFIGDATTKVTILPSLSDEDSDFLLAPAPEIRDTCNLFLQTETSRVFS